MQEDASSKADALQLEPAPPPEVAGKREDMLRRGRDLAARVMEQHRRLWVAPFNREEQWRLDGLQRKWVAYEKDARAQGIDVDKEFARERLDLLRPYQREITTRDLARMRRTLSPWDGHMQSVALARRAERQNERTEDDGSIWGGMPRGL